MYGYWQSLHRKLQVITGLSENVKLRYHSGPCVRSYTLYSVQLYSVLPQILLTLTHVMCLRSLRLANQTIWL